MIDYSLVKMMHRHGDGWGDLELVEETDAGHHSSAAHDPERSPRGWVQRFACTKCGEEFVVTGEDPGAKPKP